jgi:hypothetical protein
MKLSRPILILSLLLAGLSNHAAAQAVGAGEPVELDSRAFAGEMERITAAAQKLGGDAAAARELRSSLPDKWEVVQRGGGGREVIAADALRTPLEEYEKHPAAWKVTKEKLLARAAEMKRLADEMAEENASGAPIENLARSKLAEILKRREFAGVGPPGLIETWREKIKRWLLEQLGRLLGPLFRSRSAGEVLVWVLVGLVFLLLALWLGRYLARSRLQMLSLEPAVPAGKSWRDWAREALEASREGRYREALHAAYWTGVHRLEELGAWNRDRARTPREYLRILRAPGKSRTAGEQVFAATTVQRNALAALTERFEVTWYGYHEAGESDFHHALEQLEALGCRLT